MFVYELSGCGFESRCNQVNDLVNKILKGIGKRDSASEDSASEDSASEDSASEDSVSESEDSESEDLTPQNLESFFKKYENKHIKTFHKDSGIRNSIDTDEINNNIKDYIDGIIFKYNFSQKYNTFIDSFNKFESIQEKKKRGVIGSEQKNILKYGK